MEGIFFDYHILGEYAALSIIGFLLILDNFRVSIGLGTLNISSSSQRQIALAFGLFESITPIVGLIIGNSFSLVIGQWTEYIGPIIVGSYGLYVISLDRLEKTEQLLDRRWLLLGLPVSLSLDNLIAGIGLGIVGFQIVPYAIIIGATSGLMSLVGMRLGNTIRKYMPYKADLLGGVVLIVVALSMLTAEAVDLQ